MNTSNTVKSEKKLFRKQVKYDSSATKHRTPKFEVNDRVVHEGKNATIVGKNATIVGKKYINGKYYYRIQYDNGVYNPISEDISAPGITAANIKKRELTKIPSYESTDSTGSTVS